MSATASEALVLRVNEFYHDAEGAEYNNRHPEIFQEEQQRWARLSEHLLGGDRPAMRILDFGSGTGFVGLCLQPHLRPDDELICADLSGGMLEVCQQRLEEHGLGCTLNYLKLENDTPDLPPQSLDRVCMNSVLHHLPDPQGQLHALARLLKPGGKLAIAHEPNAGFYTDRRRRVLARGLEWCFDGVARRRPIRRAAAAMGLLALLRKLTGGNVSRSQIFARVNQRLLEGNHIDQPMTEHELGALIDFHSPTSGDRLDMSRGFSPRQIVGWLDDFELDHLETYHHLGPISRRNKLTRRLDERYRQRTPECGSLFVLVLQKRVTTPPAATQP